MFQWSSTITLNLQSACLLYATTIPPAWHLSVCWCSSDTECGDHVDIRLFNFSINVFDPLNKLFPCQAHPCQISNGNVQEAQVLSPVQLCTKEQSVAHNKWQGSSLPHTWVWQDHQSGSSNQQRHIYTRYIATKHTYPYYTTTPPTHIGLLTHSKFIYKW